MPIEQAKEVVDYAFRKFVTMPFLFIAGVAVLALCGCFIYALISERRKK